MALFTAIATLFAITAPQAIATAPTPDRHLQAAIRATQGMASYYCCSFHGRTTASGERFNQYALTAAHPYLKFGTRVKVTNLNNKRTVIVRISDRGPWIGSRIIDLSLGAAKVIGLDRSGVAPVSVQVL